MKKSKSFQKGNAQTNLKHVIAVKPMASRRLINNNIKEILFKNKLRSYEKKKKSLLISCKKLKKSYVKCVQMSKQFPSTLGINIENVDHVVIYFNINLLVV